MIHLSPTQTTEAPIFNVLSHVLINGAHRMWEPAEGEATHVYDMRSNYPARTDLAALPALPSVVDFAEKVQLSTLHGVIRNPDANDDDDDDDDGEGRPWGPGVSFGPMTAGQRLAMIGRSMRDNPRRLINIEIDLAGVAEGARFNVWAQAQLRFMRAAPDGIRTTSEISLLSFMGPFQGEEAQRLSIPINSEILDGYTYPVLVFPPAVGSARARFTFSDHATIDTAARSTSGTAWSAQRALTTFRAAFDDETVDPGARVELLRQLGRMLRELHNPGAAEAAQAADLLESAGVQ